MESCGFSSKISSNRSCWSLRSFSSFFLQQKSSLFLFREFFLYLIEGLCHFLNHIVLIDNNSGRWKKRTNRLMIRFPHVKDHCLYNFLRKDVSVQQMYRGVALAIYMHSHDRFGFGIHQHGSILVSLFTAISSRPIPF
jgi:hypothetical protein